MNIDVTLITNGVPVRTVMALDPRTAEIVRDLMVVRKAVEVLGQRGCNVVAVSVGAGRPRIEIDPPRDVDGLFKAVGIRTVFRGSGDRVRIAVATLPMALDLHARDCRVEWPADG